MILYFSFIFIFYFGYVLFVGLIPFFPQLQSHLISFLSFLPKPIHFLFNLVFIFHIWLGVFLALLTFVSDLSDDFVHNRSVKEHILRLFQPFSKSVLFVTVLFFGSVGVGCAAGFFYPQIFESLFRLSGLPDTASWDFVFSIFFNNIKIIFMCLMFGFIVLILPILMSFFDGFTIGIVAEYTIKNVGILFLLVGLAPHSIIEIPIVLLGIGISFRLGTQAIQVVFKKAKFESFKNEFIDAFWFFFLICIPAVFIAAVIEVFVTVSLLKFF